MAAPQIPREQSQTVGRMSLEQPLYVMQSLAAYMFHNRTKSFYAVPPHTVNKGHTGAPGGLFWKFGVSSHPTLLLHPAPPFLVATITSLPEAPRPTLPRLFPPAPSLVGEVWSRVFQHPQPASSLGVREALPFLSKFQATARKREPLTSLSSSTTTHKRPPPLSPKGHLVLSFCSAVFVASLFAHVAPSPAHLSQRTIPLKGRSRG